MAGKEVIDLTTLSSEDDEPQQMRARFGEEEVQVVVPAPAPAFQAPEEEDEEDDGELRVMGVTGEVRESGRGCAFRAAFLTLALPWRATGRAEGLSSPTARLPQLRVRCGRDDDAQALLRQGTLFALYASLRRRLTRPACAPAVPLLRV